MWIVHGILNPGVKIEASDLFLNRRLFGFLVAAMLFHGRQGVIERMVRLLVAALVRRLDTAEDFVEAWDLAQERVPVGAGLFGDLGQDMLVWKDNCRGQRCQREKRGDPHDGMAGSLQLTNPKRCERSIQKRELDESKFWIRNASSRRPRYGPKWRWYA
jgi:hypothetical protein